MSTPFGTQKLIFDIETVGVEFETLDKISREYIEKYTEDEEELEEAKERLGFSPLTGEIVTIGVLNPDTSKGAIYLRSNGARMKSNENRIFEKNSFKLEDNSSDVTVETGDEKQILEKFWEAAKSYNYFITFSGRTFDSPFLMIRSAILGVRPSKNLLSNRYLNLQKYDATHVDLLDQLTFYGTVRKKFNLHFWCQAFGIKSPKGEGITGDEVGKLYKEGKLLEIAKYNLGDLKATKELYDRWYKYLNL